MRDTKGLDIIDRGMQRDRFGDHGCARFETLRRRGVRRTRERHRLDHGAAALVRRHGVKQGFMRPQDTDPRWAIQLVTGEGVEVAAQCLHVERDARCSLAPIEQQFRADRMGDVRCLARIEHRTKNVRYMRQRNHLGSRVHHGGQSVQIDLAVFGQRANLDPCSGSLGKELPGHDI